MTSQTKGRLHFFRTGQVRQSAISSWSADRACLAMMAPWSVKTSSVLLGAETSRDLISRSSAEHRFGFGFPPRADMRRIRTAINKSDALGSGSILNPATVQGLTTAPVEQQPSRCVSRSHLRQGVTAKLKGLSGQGVMSGVRHMAGAF